MNERHGTLAVSLLTGVPIGAVEYAAVRAQTNGHGDQGGDD